jgi:hypothetical protein
MLIMYDSKPDGSLGDNIFGYGDSGPLVVVEFDVASGVLTANVSAQADPSGTTSAVTNIALGTLSSTMRRFRIDFAWDYFILPHNFASFTNPPSRGEPWFYVRVSYYDPSLPGWVQPYSRLPHGNGRTDGWVEFGDETMNLNGKTSGKLAIDRYDWITGSWSSGPPPTYDPVYTYWYFDNSNLLHSGMTWQIDNVDISQVDSALRSANHQARPRSLGGDSGNILLGLSGLAEDTGRSRVMDQHAGITRSSRWQP